MKCEDCNYYWQEEGDDYPCCHFQDKAPGDYAPCEIDDDGLPYDI